MDLLVQTEQNLAVEVSGNYQRLLEQQREHEASNHVYLYVAKTHTIYTWKEYTFFFLNDTVSCLELYWCAPSVKNRSMQICR